MVIFCFIKEAIPLQLLFSDKNNELIWMLIFPVYMMITYYKSIIITAIFNLRMHFKLILHVFDLFLFHLSSANRTFFNFRNLIVHQTSKLVFLTYSLHKPISINTNQMESMIALINTNQIISVCKTLLLFIIFFFFIFTAKLFQTYCTPPFYCIIVLG